ncbi:uncharacterized protein TM35_000321120 [Trypanosoma theileri]|uniref:Uncharacterized protein n=1 Tax=Trypanosoma theileri TaxID=67003 RepID=A0A1X0NM86_9TRYP|nr:uncharacterized protein TM35_000321120 [Trypanosoma theileri]ORC85797.1 hypothetical protein TM35_000321120 [Trypanosoma theileri]
MYSSPLAVDQRRCPSFYTEPETHRARSLAAVLQSTPASLYDVAFDTTPPRARTPREVYADMRRCDAAARERREAAVEAQRRRELSQCRPAPHVSAVARQLQRDGPIVDRLLRLHDERRRLEEHRRLHRDREAQQQQQRDGWFRPAITERGRHAEGRALSLAQRPLELCREEERERERERLAAAAARHRREHETRTERRGSTRAMSARRNELARRARERDGGEDIARIDAILIRDRIAQLERWEQHQQGIQTPHNNNNNNNTAFSPRITAYAATLDRDENITKRLMTDARRRNERLHEESNATPLNSTTSGRGQAYTPTIDSVSAMIAAGLPSSSNERLMSGLRWRNNINNNNNNNVNNSSTSNNNNTNTNSNSRNHSGGIFMDEDLGVKEYVPSIHTPRNGGPNISSPRRKSDIYERMCLWQKRRDDKVRELRHILQEESKEQEGVKNEVNSLRSPDIQQTKFFPVGPSTPRSQTIEREGAKTALVLSLLRNQMNIS